MGDQSSRLADDMHPSTFIVEEMMARGWTSDHLAVAMAMHSKHDACICKMKIDMYLTGVQQSHGINALCCKPPICGTFWNQRVRSRAVNYQHPASSSRISRAPVTTARSSADAARAAAWAVRAASVPSQIAESLLPALTQAVTQLVRVSIKSGIRIAHSPEGFGPVAGCLDFGIPLGIALSRPPRPEQRADDCARRREIRGELREKPRDHFRPRGVRSKPSFGRL